MNQVCADTVDTLRGATTTPRLVRVRQLRFLRLDGYGDPNTSPEFADAIQALYAVSYGARFAIKKACGPSYRMSPLEGLFWSEDPAGFANASKADWSWRMLIGQSEQVDTGRRAAPEKLRTIIRQPYAG